ncbi:MAG TPA: hypothetical protein VM163_05075 [bacterium]|nr:hypothetical protein [bacterium]
MTERGARRARGREAWDGRGQKALYWGPLHFAEKFLLRTFLAPWSYAASIIYHDWYWYPFIGKKRVDEALKTKWGQLFQQY